MKNLYLILGLLFLSFAVVQYNDPDPYIWAPYYLLVSAVCFLSYANRYNKLLGMILIGISIIWASSYLPKVVDWYREGSPGIATAMKAETPYIENMREFLGLVLSIAVLSYVHQKNK